MEMVTVKYTVTKTPPAMPFFFFTVNVWQPQLPVLFCFFNTNFTNCLHITIIKLVTGWVLKQDVSIGMAQNFMAE